MSEPNTSSAPERTVDDILSGGEPLAEDRALQVVLQLTRSVAALHAAGKLHRAIVTHVTFDAAGDVQLQPAPVSFTFDGSIPDRATCPPELHGVDSLTLPIGTEQAGEMLRQTGFSFDPCRIDVYQLGVVLCRLATGESVDSYLRSPKVKVRLSPKMREIIDSALGYDSASRYTSVTSLAAAIQACADTPAIGRDTDVLVPHGQPDTDAGKLNAQRVGSGADHAASRAGLPFQKLGHFEILESIGRGGMGDVYKGYERSLNRVVAIKVLPSELGRDESFVRRFYAEASAAAELIHPNIIQIFFIGEDAGHHYFAMQYIRGETIADVLARRFRLSVDETLTIIEQVLIGLGAAHRHGLVHRDVKPGNILIDRKHERVLLADFGLVKSRGDRMTVTGVIMGTVDYISPEQGRGKTVDSRSDLYSIGVLMYQMLSGRLPFEADSATAMIFQHVYQQPRPLREIVPDVPAPLAALIARLMAKDPKDRPQTAERVFDEILASWPSPRSKALPPPSDVIVTDVEIVDESPRTSVISAPTFDELPPPRIELPDPPKTSWWIRGRNQLLGRMQAYAPELSERLQGTQQLVDGAVAEYQRRRERLQTLIAEAEGVREQLAQQAKCNDEARQARQLHEDEAQGAEELEQALHVQTEELETMRANLARVNATLAGLRSQRDQLNARLKLANVQRGRALSPAQRRIRKLRFILALSVAGAVLVTAGLFIAEYAIRTARHSVESTIATIANAQPSYVPRFQLFNQGYDPDTLQPNETSIDVSEIIEPPPAMPLRQLIGHEGTVMQVAFNSTGTLLASASYDYTVRLWDPQTGVEINKFEGSHLRAFDSLSFSADGRFLAAGALGSTPGADGLIIWDVTSGQVVHRLAQGREVGSIAYSPTESLLAILEPSYKNRSTILTLWRSQTGEQAGSVTPGARIVGDTLAYSPDGKLLALVVDPYRIVLWNVSENQVERTFAFEYVVQENAVLAFSPRGDVLAVAGHAFAGGYTNVAENFFGEVQIFTVASGDLIGSFKVPEATTLWSVAFHPTQPLVAAATNKGARIWDLRSGQVVQVMGTHAPASVAFSPDGNTLATGGGMSYGSIVGKQHPWLLLWEIKTTQSPLRNGT